MSYLLCSEGSERREIYFASDVTGNKRNIGWMLILKSNYKLGSEEAGVSLVMNDGNDSGPWHQSVVSGQAPHQTSQITDPQPPARFNYKCITRVNPDLASGLMSAHRTLVTSTAMFLILKCKIRKCGSIGGGSLKTFRMIGWLGWMPLKAGSKNKLYKAPP